MQTIARANRVAEGKTNGIIVDYIGVFKNVEKALALYASTKTDDDEIIKNKSELLGELTVILNQTKEFLKQYSIIISILLEAPGDQKLLLIESYANKLLTNSEIKKDFLNLSSALYDAYQAVLPDPDAQDFYNEVIAVRVIASRVRDIGLKSFDTVSYTHLLEKW